MWENNLKLHDICRCGDCPHFLHRPKDRFLIRFEDKDKVPAALIKCCTFINPLAKKMIEFREVHETTVPSCEGDRCARPNKKD